MIITSHHLAELTYYLSLLQTLTQNSPLEKPIFKEGTTVGQIAFHTAEAADYWLRAVVLQGERKRDRESEFSKTHSLESINHSINQALQACQEIVTKKVEIETQLEKPAHLSSVDIEVKTVYEALVHATAHTAEHVGQLQL